MPRIFTRQLDPKRSAHGAIQKAVMKRVVLKSTPVLTFRHDDSATRSVEIVNLLQEVEKRPKAPEIDEEA